MHWQITTLSILVFNLLVFGWQESSQAEIMLATPAGLHVGDTFRFVFLTDAAIDATSPAIATYDNLVNTEANSTLGVKYAGNPLAWQAIASTPTIVAKDHIGLSHSDQVFLVDGTLVASSIDPFGLWSGILLHAINKDLSGLVVHNGNEFVWTGTGPFGLPLSALGNTGLSATFGVSELADSRWVSNQPGAAIASHLPLYGISQEIIVSVPEPSTRLILGIGSIVFGLWAFACKRKSQLIVSADAA